MGVHGLWDLLAPVGRRVSVETLSGKRLAIDASIWMIQFMKAMRDDKGEMVCNAHLLGFFRRICKLLYLRTKPIFVFDGGTPSLKRRTVIARRRQRENAQAKIRKTAEKLLLNQLKQMKLKELADELDKQRKDNDAKGKTVATREELEKQNNGDDSKGKKVITDAEMGDKKSGGSGLYADRCNQEAVDEMLAASLLAEEDEVFTVGESSSGLLAEAEDEGEEMILPTMHGKVDPAILAALPPSMQLDLLVQMRERLMAENRQKYQKVKRVPARFSELQIKAYLKTVAFRREIDEVQKCAAGRGVGGVQTSRIASEANREFIFSSSFCGDKQVLASAGEGTRTSNASLSTATSSANTVDVTMMKNSVAASESPENEPQRDLDDDIETYLDERGCLRVSRVRAMGIRMTRDIQRNLDFMKEFEKEQGVAENASNASTIGAGEIEATPDAQSGMQFFGDVNNSIDGITSTHNKNEETALDNGCAIEISFENNGVHEHTDADDDLFARLVGGDPVMDFSVSNSPSKIRPSDSSSECQWEEGGMLRNDMKVDSEPLATDGGVDNNNELEWEEGGDLSIDVGVDNISVPGGGMDRGWVLESDNGGTSGNDFKVDTKKLVADGGMNNECEIEWKEHSSDIQEESSSCPAECRKITSKGDLEEEADFQEAIRRSLLDLEDQRSLNTLHEHYKSKAATEVSNSKDMGFHYKEDPNKPVVSSACKFEEQNPVPGHSKRMDSSVEWSISGASNCLSPPLVNCEGMESTTEKACQKYTNEGLLTHEASEERNVLQDELVDSVAVVHEKDISHIAEQLTYASGRGSDVHYLNAHSNETTLLRKASGDNSTKEADTTREMVHEEDSGYISTEQVETFHNSASLEGKKRIEIREANLEEEMLILGEEERQLGDERRKLERNAESVNSEMFAECQELLQIFGLPFIIAPMEAEAQCAYMELSNLVDGVVTDDSDAFLFGARSVYKNIFDDRKYVETYFMKDIENELGLNREKLINMALLLGSDYTEGVSGIGIVNAIEVVNAFPEEDGLRKFREWIESPDPSILGKCEVQAGVNLRKRESKVGGTDMSCSDNMGVDETQKIRQIFMDKHRNVSKNWHIPSSFPSDAVISAYTSPQVDKSTEPFSWGKPDHFMLRKLCWEKFGWSTPKADELLLPVLKEYSKRETQLRLEAFYSFNERFAKIRSKRIKKALKGMTNNKSLDLMDAPDPISGKRALDQGVPIGDRSEKALEGPDFEDAKKVPNGTERSVEEGLSEKTAQRESSHAVGNRKRSSIEAETCRIQNEELRCKGRGRGKGRNKCIGKRIKRTDSSLQHAEYCSNDESNSDNENESQVKSGGQCQVRRSQRPRKKVDYTMSDSTHDGSDQDDGSSQNEKSEGRASSPEFLDTDHAVTSPPKINASEIFYQVSPQECPEKGDWFCTHKIGPETRVVESSSNDYLTMGGGFCLGDDDANENSGGPASPNIATTLDPDLPNDSIGFDDRNCTSNPSQSINNPSGTEGVGTCNTKQNADDITNINGCPLLQKISPDGGDAMNESVSSLRAMPNLRKKRRKG